MLQLIGGTVGMMDISRGLNPQQVRSINKAVRGVQVSSMPQHRFVACLVSINQWTTLEQRMHIYSVMDGCLGDKKGKEPSWSSIYCVICCSS